MAILNSRYFAFPPQTRLSTPPTCPFELTSKTRRLVFRERSEERQCPPFLWCILMGLSDQQPDDDDVVQCALQLHRINSILWHPIQIGKEDIDKFKSVCFDFGKSFSTVCQVGISCRFDWNCVLCMSNNSFFSNFRSRPHHPHFRRRQHGDGKSESPYFVWTKAIEVRYFLTGLLSYISCRTTKPAAASSGRPWPLLVTAQVWS